MTAVQPPAPNEPPPPQRGMTREERGRDVSAVQAKAEAETSTVKRYLKFASPRFLWSAEGQARDTADASATCSGVGRTPV